MKIAVVEGDGIGKEVTPVARAVISRLCPDIEFFDVEVGYGRWERTGSAVSPEDISLLGTADAILFGAITTPPSPDYKSVVVQIRKALDLYANVRPVWGKKFDMLIVRENTEGLYSGIEKIEEDSACTLRCISRIGSERIARYACSLARKRRDLTLGHKANVLKSDVFFRDICIDVANREGVPYKECYIDALCLDVLQNPDRYDVIVTTNMFGDILSDVVAYLVGGLGLLPSANIGERHALFEPVHGSAPDIAGRDIANPIAALRSAALLLRHIGEPQCADLVEEAIQHVISRGIRTRDMGGNAATSVFGREVLEEVSYLLPKK
ncbi:MAG TPA: isocitrate/isopropylmalate family dehydrogenase [Methanoregulaceae archaeon]|nr:isocitrate/isopropylmalate family dehydrogenase [Methanoregulaceae archaeon]